jgi:hypothetical protein
MKVIKKYIVHITVVLILEHQTMDKVQETNDVKCDIPSSESYRKGIIMLFVVDVHIYNAATPLGHITHCYVCVNCNSEITIDLSEMRVSLYVPVNSLYDSTNCLLYTMLCIIQYVCQHLLLYSGHLFARISSFMCAQLFLLSLLSGL